MPARPDTGYCEVYTIQNSSQLEPRIKIENEEIDIELLSLKPKLRKTLASAPGYRTLRLSARHEKLESKSGRAAKVIRTKDDRDKDEKVYTTIKKKKLWVFIKLTDQNVHRAARSHTLINSYTIPLDAITVKVG